MRNRLLDYFPFLANRRKLLVLSNKDFLEYNDLFEYFEMTLFEAINDVTIEHISYNFTKNGIDTVLFAPEPTFTDPHLFYEKLKSIDERIEVLFIIPKASNETFRKCVNLYDMVLCEPFTREAFIKKFFTMLSDTYAISSIADRDVSLSQAMEKRNLNELEEFLDTYEGTILFLSENLTTLSTHIKSGDISMQTMQRVSSEMGEVSEIFSYHSYTKHVSPVFDSLGDYLKHLKLEHLSVSNLEGFDFLANIIDDINVYLVEYFVERIFQDVYIFEHSLQSNIEFMKNRLEGVVGDDGELEFF